MWEQQQQQWATGSHPVPEARNNIKKNLKLIKEKIIIQRPSNGASNTDQPKRLHSLVYTSGTL